LFISARETFQPFKVI